MELKQIWPEWKVTEVIKKGNISTVYKAERESFNETFYSAIKQIKIPQNQSEYEEARQQGAKKQDLQEYYKSYADELIKGIKILESLKGAKNIVNIEDYKIQEEEIGFSIYTRTDLLTNLKQYFLANKPNENKVIKMGIDICNALQICENAEIIHSNLKPENIFVTRFGEFKLGDFLLAKSAKNEDTSIVKKRNISYMAPEVYRGYSCTASSDLYSLGIIMYQYLNNKKMPFMPEKITYQSEEKAFLTRISGQSLTKPKDMSNELFNVICKMCSPNIEERYESAAKAKQALERISAKTKEEPEDMEATVSIFSSQMRKERMEKFKKEAEPKQEKIEVKEEKKPEEKPVKTKRKKNYFLMGVIAGVIGIAIFSIFVKPKEEENIQPEVQEAQIVVLDVVRNELRCS